MDFESILTERTYDRLSVVRMGRVCNLLIDADGKSHVYTTEKGKCPEFRHAWQIKDWLEQKYGIEDEELEVRILR